MRAFWDHSSLQLPYIAHAPWPFIELNGQGDWIDCVLSVETWLEHRIGPHYLAWTWATLSLHQTSCCAVTFQKEKYRTLFLLRYGG
jgi:hypothetical protein